jgi:3-hydroxyisobutyrate dehydrogenase
VVVAFLGTGAMGAPMARNIAAAGHDVRAWNRTPARAEAIAGERLTAWTSASEAAAGADVLVTMLADGAATAEATGGALREGLVWAQMGTVGLEWNERLAEQAASAGASFVDAPVLGSLPAAESAELIVLASGPDAAIDAAQPVFDAIGTETHRLGDVGAGTRMKLVFNYWVLVLTALTGETVALADGLGAGGGRFLELIAGRLPDSAYAQMKGKKMVTGDLSPMFRLVLGRKDVALALEAARDAQLDLAVGDAVLAEMDLAIRRGYGDADTAAVIEATRRGSA